MANPPIEDFDLTKYPDYREGLPPDVYKLAEYSYLDEYEAVWGRPWGSPGIGKLREVALVSPTDHEGNPLWMKDPSFFLLRYKSDLDIDLMIRNHHEYAELLTQHEVDIHWMEFKNPWGAWGPMRKLFVCEEIRFVRGGAILPRFGHASYKRGLEREFQRFLTEIGCPILYSVHGEGIMEVAPMFVAVAEDVFIAGLSCAANQDGLDQVLPVMYRSGVKEVHVIQLPTIIDSFKSGGEFHVDMIISAVDDRKVLVWPQNLPYETYVWLRDKGFEIIEIAAEDQKYSPANLVLLEPGKVIMPKRAEETIKRVRKSGVEVIEFDSDGIMQGGVNGLKCITMEVLRDAGPGLDD